MPKYYTSNIKGMQVKMNIFAIFVKSDNIYVNKFM